MDERAVGDKNEQARLEARKWERLRVSRNNQAADELRQREADFYRAFGRDMQEPNTQADREATGEMIDLILDSADELYESAMGIGGPFGEHGVHILGDEAAETFSSPYMKMGWTRLVVVDDAEDVYAGAKRYAEVITEEGEEFVDRMLAAGGDDPLGVQLEGTDQRDMIERARTGEPVLLSV